MIKRELNMSQTPYEPPVSSSGQASAVKVNPLVKILLGGCISVLAALGACGVLYFKHEFFTVDNAEFGIGMGAPAEARLRLFAEQARILRLNALVTFAIAGGLLAAGISLAGAPCCSVPTKMAAGAIWGTLWGAVSGFLGAAVFNSMIQYGTQAEAVQAGLAHGAAFSILGAGIGLMFGGYHRGLSPKLQGLIVGAVAGLAGGIGYSAAGLFIPSHSTEDMLPVDNIVRLLWLTVPFAFIGFLLPSMIRED